MEEVVEFVKVRLERRMTDFSCNPVVEEVVDS